MKRTTLVLLIFITFSACNNVQSRLDKAEKEIEYAEQNKEEMTAKDWSTLEKKMQELESDLEQNRDKYTDEQAKEIGKIEARLASDPPVKKTSNAPAPISPVTARSNGAPSHDTTDPRSIKSMTTSQWIEAERARQMKKYEAQRNR